MQGYATNSGHGSDNFHAAKPVFEQISECDQIINKVHIILESLNIPRSRYETELNELKFTFSSISNSLKQTRLTSSNLTDQISRVLSKSVEGHIWIENIESNLAKSRD